MYPLLNFALTAAKKSSTLLLREFERIEDYPLQRESIAKTARKAAENYFARQLLETYSDHGIIFSSEEAIPSAETIWWVDVINGEMNYKRGVPHFALCLAIQHRGKFEYALIYDPLLNEAFSAKRQGVAQCNHKRIQVSDRKNLDQAALTGNQAIYFSRESIVYNYHCSALSLAYVARGCLDGFIGKSLSKVEIAAGNLLVQCSGGLCTDHEGGHDFFNRQELIAANPKLLKFLLKR